MGAQQPLSQQPDAHAAPSSFLNRKLYLLSVICLVYGTKQRVENTSWIPIYSCGHKPVCLGKMYVKIHVKIDIGLCDVTGQ